MDGTQTKGVIGCFAAVAVLATVLMSCPSRKQEIPKNTIPADVAASRYERAQGIVTTYQQAGLIVRIRQMNASINGIEAAVSPIFSEMDFEDKKNLAMVLSVLPDRGQGKALVVFRDSRSNKELGTYSEELGLRLK